MRPKVRAIVASPEKEVPSSPVVVWKNNPKLESERAVGLVPVNERSKSAEVDGTAAKLEHAPIGAKRPLGTLLQQQDGLKDGTLARRVRAVDEIQVV